MKNLKSKAFYPALCLFTVCLVVALLLVGANELTSEKIELLATQKIQITCKELVPEAFEFEESTIENAVVYKGLDESGETVGYAVRIEAKGYGGTIVLMVGTDTSAVITKVQILEHSETPGLGAKAADSAFLSQFEGKQENITLGNGIDAVTNATISSTAVTKAVNQAQSIIGGLING